MVDDMLFFNHVDLTGILSTFDDKSFSIHLKLSPNIQYSHTNDKIINLAATFLKKSENVYKYRRCDTHLDWDYPFDFCGSLYRWEHVKWVFENVQPREKVLRPNHFEYYGNLALKDSQLLKDYPLC